MGKVEIYREKLRGLESWDPFLLDESNLPGPRANLELAFAVAQEGSETQLLRFARLTPREAPKNSKKEFLAFCGVLGLGYLVSRGDAEYFELLRARASDKRWRIREAVALGLQKYGALSIEQLLKMMEDWSAGSLLERRAVVATLCEPNLLAERTNALKIIDIIDRITSSIVEEEDRKDENFKVLRKALGYGWSVLVAAHPALGKPAMEKWVKSNDKDIIWIMKQNFKKKRLLKMDPDWVSAQLVKLGN